MPLPTIVSGNVASATAGAFEVANSCRFNGSDSYLSWRDTGQGGSQKLNSISLWCKKCSNGVFNPLFLGRQNGSNFTFLQFDDDDRLDFYNEHGNAIKGRLRTNRVFRDPSAWYHILAIWDSGNATAGNRMRLYVNGVEETSFETDTNPDEDQDSWFFLQNIWMYIGYDYGDLDVGHSSAKAFDGYIAQVLLVDGVIKSPTDMGEFYEDSPTIWKPKDISGEEGTGTNGALLLFGDSSDLGANEHGASAPNDDWTSTNLAAVDQATDTPTNNFCTMSPLWNFTNNVTLSEGNCKIVSSGSWSGAGATIGLTAGKWYYEVKMTALPGGGGNGRTGFFDSEVTHTSGNIFQQTNGATYFYNEDGGEIQKDNSITTADYGQVAQGSILGVALNMDDKQVTFYDDNVAIVTNLALSTNGTSGIVIPSSGINTETQEYNFGNPPYSLTSAANDENGYGNFEFAPPSGYLAICTKNLGSDGG